MNNKIRVLLLFTMIGLIGFGIYNLMGQINTTGTPLKVKVTEKGVDVEIENFKIEHEVLGRKDWELKADFAQIDNQKNITRLQNVEVVLTMENNEKSFISADAGVMNNDTQDIDLQGHVKFVASAEEFKKRFQQGREPGQESKEKGSAS